MRAIWTLADVGSGDGGLVVVPCTHKANVQTPAAVQSGSDDMGLSKHLELGAGDLVIAADTVLRSFRPWRGAGPMRLLEYSFAARGVISRAGTGSETESDPYPEWMRDLAPEQRAVMYQPGYTSSTPAPTVISRNGRSELAEHRELIHPSIYKLDPDSEIDRDEFFFWDLCGHLVIRDIMSPDDLEIANEAIDRYEDRIVVGEELSRARTVWPARADPSWVACSSSPSPIATRFAA